MGINENDKDAVPPARPRESAAEDFEQEPAPMAREPAMTEPEPLPEPDAGPGKTGTARRDAGLGPGIVDEEMPLPVGAMLREARKRRGLGIFEVSERLFLTEHYVRALETDDYEKLPGEVYVKGYMKSYAQLLGLDPEQVMEAYRQSAVAVADDRGPATVVSMKSGRGWLAPFLIAILLGLVAATAWWAYQTFWAFAGMLAAAPARERRGIFGP